MHEMFDDIIAANIITFSTHPTAKTMKRHVASKEVLKFDPNTDWNERQKFYRFAHTGHHNRHYLTYGGGPEGGIIKSCGDGWCVWRRN